MPSSAPTLAPDHSPLFAHSGLDRERLLDIERLANEVLAEQENLRLVDERRTQAREAQGVFRRKEITGEKECWMQMPGTSSTQQFISIPVTEAKRRTDADAAIAQKDYNATSKLVKENLRKLYTLQPKSAEIAPGVMDMLCAERERERREREERRAAQQEEEKKSNLSAGKRGNCLDYSRFDHIDSDSSAD